MPKKILIASHDAGAAEIIAAWIKKRSKKNFIYLLRGPAASIFERKLGVLARVEFDDLDEIRGDLGAVITGTSWASDLEKRVLVWAKRNAIRSTTFLDHWSNYRERFETTDGVVLPDEIVVHDEFAEKRAWTELRHPHIERRPNPYTSEIVARIHQIERTLGLVDRSAPVSILYVAQPISDVAETLTGRRDGFGYSEFEALENFIDWLKKHSARVGAFRIRPHPSERPGKYDEFVQSKLHRLNVSVSLNKDLAQDIAWADWVVGCDTMALVIALMAERKVFSCIPRGGRKLEIPHPGIKRLFE